MFGLCSGQSLVSPQWLPGVCLVGVPWAWPATEPILRSLPLQWSTPKNRKVLLAPGQGRDALIGTHAWARLARMSRAQSHWPCGVSKENPVSGEDVRLPFAQSPSLCLSRPSPDVASFGKSFLLSSQASLKI